MLFFKYCFLFLGIVTTIYSLLYVETDLGYAVSNQDKSELQLSNPSFSADLNLTSHENGQNISIVSGSSFPSNFDFYDPNELTVPEGSVVRWVNDDSAVHTVTSGTGLLDPSNGEAFDSGNLLATQYYEHRFDDVGTYDYFCALHPFMTGKIMVVSAS